MIDLHKIRHNKHGETEQGRPIILRIAVTALFAACVIYIWHNSMENAAQSSARSGQLTAIINEILAGLSKGGKLSITEIFVRKCAHFAEYFLQSILTVFLFWAYEWKPRKRWWAVILIGAFVAAVDESIQLFSVGRSAALLDVGIDMLGFFSGLLMMLVFYYIYRKFSSFGNPSC